MPTLQPLNADNFALFSNQVPAGQDAFLPMIFGTRKEAQKQTQWLSAYDPDHLYLVDDQGSAPCLYALRRQGEALWFSFIQPANWAARFDIFADSLPRLLALFNQQRDYQYLYGKMESADTPPTLLPGYLPEFLRHRFKTEHRMWLRRSNKLPVPPALDLPTAFTQNRFADKLVPEIADLVAEVFTREEVDFSVDDAREELESLLGDELFRQSAMLLRNTAGQLVAAGWCMGKEQTYPGEMVVLQEYQGQGLGRYLLTQCIRTLAQVSPDQDIELCTCREWTKAVRLYEQYDFAPYDFWTYISFRRN
ncbi:MAG: GNAT family N-acetyltransferase [Candidatus Latescibacteria bacterium]|nr:GNAT family N-acetyltransferase [Candidatus Latescibacterota bacterium]